jgi:hypothetical protein
MKFDVVVANPPYKAGLHLKFLEWAHDNADHIVFIHPAEWLVQKRRITKHAHKRRWYKELRDKLTPRCKSVTFIDNPWEEAACLFVPLSITNLSNSSSVIKFEDKRSVIYNTKISIRSEQLVNHLDFCGQWGNGQTETNVLEKVYTHDKTWKPHMYVERGNYYLNLSLLAGNGKTHTRYLDGQERTVSNMWTLVNRFTMCVLSEPARAKPHKKRKEGNIKPWASFPTEHEAQNALDFIARTKFMRAWLAIIKIDQHAADRLMDDIPWLDWSEPWPDERINDYFGFTDEEVAWIDQVVEEISV